VCPMCLHSVLRRGDGGSSALPRVDAVGELVDRLGQIPAGLLDLRPELLRIAHWSSIRLLMVNTGCGATALLGHLRLRQSDLVPYECRELFGRSTHELTNGLLRRR
jgi:hypothetical protein